VEAVAEAEKHKGLAIPFEILKHHTGTRTIDTIYVTIMDDWP
jgi:hypothetical protein